MASPGCGQSPRRSCGCGRSRIEPGANRGHTRAQTRGRTRLTRLVRHGPPGVIDGGKPMNGTGRPIGIVLAALLGAAATAAPALAQNEQFIPNLVYRSGAYAPNGIPFANGVADYYSLINERDGGINGVKIVYEECDTAYATDRGVECYERLKNKGPTGAAYVNPLFFFNDSATTEKA